MPSTTVTAKRLPVVGVEFADGTVMTFGVATLATGTVELDTGLGICQALYCTGVSGTDTKGVTFTVMENLPISGKAITVDGTLIEHAAATANAASDQFCWVAFGTV